MADHVAWTGSQEGDLVANGEGRRRWWPRTMSGDNGAGIAKVRTRTQDVALPGD